MGESYPEFFLRATEKEILPYQQAYGEDPFVDALLVIPTGLGKTNAVIVPWLFAQAHKKIAPTRCIIVLPRQNLTSQTAKTARELVERTGLQNDVSVLELMGGSKEDNDRKLRPDESAVIVCTQDMYFSRALNRGFARRPAHWPIDFGLYNQDCLIVLDEVQLMEDALATSAQLAAFRRKFGIYGSAPCVWMSATARPEWLKTVDFDAQPRQIRLGDKDRVHPIVNERIHAKKVARPAPEECRTPEGCANFVLSHHQAGTRSLVIANTVARAREIASGLRKAKKLSSENILLVHSRFRPPERRSMNERLAASGALPVEGQIVVATQVLEAGIDISARMLVTDVAPWGSLVQRFGRVNRMGKDEGAEIWWVSEPTYSKQKYPYAPYTQEEVDAARLKLEDTHSAAPDDLKPEDSPEPWQNVLRKADLLDLFDTSPDLGGNDLDVSRFIRSAKERDVYLAWREWEGEPPEEWDELGDAELCPVPLEEFREFAKKHDVYWWSFAEDMWQRLDGRRAMFPGMLLLTRCAAGGYTIEEGWAPDSKVDVRPVESEIKEPLEGDSSNASSYGDYRQGLLVHTDRVCEEVEELLKAVALDAESAAALRAAARKHDWGKAHPVFQKTLQGQERPEVLLAKQCGKSKHDRKHFRHELASALAMIEDGDSDKAAYLAGAHHGRIRMSIRSMPGEWEAGGKARARGIQEGDRLNSAELLKGKLEVVYELSLKIMEFGGDGERDSWTARMQRLLREMGPFRLAYLETLLRAADVRASQEQGKDYERCPA